MAETLKRACGAPGTTWDGGILSLTEAPERLVPKATVPRATPRDCVTCPSKPDILILSRGSTRWGESVFGSMVTVVPVSTIDSYSSRADRKNRRAKQNNSHNQVRCAFLLPYRIGLRFVPYCCIRQASRLLLELREREIQRASGQRAL